MSTTTQQPDIYADHPVVDLAYKIAVMQMALKLGLEFVQDREVGHAEWKGSLKFNVERGFGNTVRFNWVELEYRIDPTMRPFVCPGYGNLELNSHEVETHKGYRLLTVDEVKACRDAGCGNHRVTHPIVSKVEYYSPSGFMGKSWHSCATTTSDVAPGIKTDGYKYRTLLTREAFGELLSAKQWRPITLEEAECTKPLLDGIYEDLRAGDSDRSLSVHGWMPLGWPHLGPSVKMSPGYYTTNLTPDEYREKYIRR